MYITTIKKKREGIEGVPPANGQKLRALQKQACEQSDPCTGKQSGGKRKKAE